MKKLLSILLLYPLLLTAQQPLPRFENDTLYTSSGYNIYKGQILHLANGTAEAGYFKFIKFHSSMGKTNTYSLQNSALLVNKLKNYKSLGNESSVRILGTVTYPDNRKEEVDIIMIFEKAVENFAGQPGELIVPGENKIKPTETVTPGIKKPNVVNATPKPSVADEIKKLFALYKEGAITREEYEAQKKKLLEKE